MLGAARRVRHRLRQMGPQPRPRRGGHRRPTAAGPACTPRRWRSTGCSTSCAQPTRTWRSSPARRAARRVDLACWSAPTGSGSRTTSTRTTGSGCCAGPASSLPPEYLGSHIASGRSHTTGRRHDLGFRAGTAIFGHLGIEWDLARGHRRRARRAQGAGSRSTRSSAGSCSAAIWCGWTGPTRIHLHGVVAPDRSRALFAAPVDSRTPTRRPASSSAASTRSGPTGCGPSSSARCRRACPPRGGAHPSDAEILATQEYWDRAERADVSYPGGRFRGDVLGRRAWHPPRLHPDQAVLYRVVAQD